MFKFRALAFLALLIVLLGSGCSVMAQQQQADAVRDVQKIVDHTWPNVPDVIKSEVFNSDSIPTILITVRDGTGSDWWLVYKATMRDGIHRSGPVVKIRNTDKFQIVGFLDGWVGISDDGVTIAVTDKSDSFYRLEGHELSFKSSGKYSWDLLMDGTLTIHGFSAEDFEKGMIKINK